LDVGTAKQRGVLAALLLDPGHPVTVDTLIGRVWDDSPPAEARNVLYAHLSRIRRLLRDAGGTDSGGGDSGGGDSGGLHSGGADALPDLERRSGAYLLRVDPEQVDLHRMRRLAEQAIGDDLQRIKLLREAIDLWRGEPLTGLPGDWFARARDGIRAEYLELVLRWARLETRYGQRGSAVAQLRALAAEHPLVEPVAAELMLALHADGRTAEAFEVYAAAQRRLADELGVTPGTELQRVHKILLGAVTTAPPSESPRETPDTPAPALLPTGVRGFTARTEELAKLDALVSDAGSAGPAPIAVISGTAGVGKTALAVYWAHRVAGRFPDGQLYVNLRGFDPTGTVLDPGEALRGFLDAFGVPARQIPSGRAAQVNLYRSLVNGRRMLVVLDNARDVEQVRPLLPGSPGSLVLVTSRSRLTGLVAAEGAHPILLDLLSTEDSRELLAARLGRDRIATQPTAVGRIVTRCTGLPLALAIVAGRAATQPDHPLDHLAAELDANPGGTSLAALATDDDSTDPRSVFSWSYRQLSEPGRRLFRLLGVHPGPDLAVPAAASLVGLPIDEVRPLLTELTRAHLVEEHQQGSPDCRYAFHDLLRAYASELVGDVDDRRLALRRTLDHYAHTSTAIGLFLDPSRVPVAAPPAPVDGVAGIDADTPTQDWTPQRAVAWFADEEPVLIAAIDRAVSEGFDEHAWHLAWALVSYMDRGGRWDDWLVTQQRGLAAAQRLGQRPMQANSERGVGRAFFKVGRYADAQRHLSAAYELYEELGDARGRANTLIDMAAVHEHDGRYAEALDAALGSVASYLSAGDRNGYGNALNAVGWYHSRMDHHAEALDYGERSLAILAETGDAYGQAYTLDSLGYALHHLGRYPEAAERYRQSIALCGQAGDRVALALVQSHLGDTLHAAGELAGATDAWRAAITLLDELDRAEAARVRAKLKSIVDQC
jgi:DNA-binding SARP family transcriptional activator